MLSRKLSSEELTAYREDGFVVLRDVLGDDELERLATGVERELGGPRERRRTTPGAGPETGQTGDYSVLIDECLGEADVNFVIDHPNILAAVETLLGDRPVLSEFSIHIKRPGWEGTGRDYEGMCGRGHFDYKPFRPVDSSLNWIFTVIPLVDYTEDIGPLLVSPGSHRCSTFEEGGGRVTIVNRAKDTGIPALVDARLRRGDVLLMHMFTWHEALANRSELVRLGAYIKYRGANAPPACGPYLYADHHIRDLARRSGRLLLDHADRPIRSTALLLESEGEVLFMQLDDGSWSLPCGVARTGHKVPGSNDDNVIEQLYAAARSQLGLELPWVSYVGDFGDVERRGLCRVYAYPLPARSELSQSRLLDVAWLSSEEIVQLHRAGRLRHGFEAEAIEQWRQVGPLRGIGKSRVQVGEPEVHVVPAVIQDAIGSPN